MKDKEQIRKKNLIKKRILKEWVYFLQHGLNWMNLTEYHKIIDDKVDELIDRINKLPSKKNGK